MRQAGPARVGYSNRFVAPGGRGTQGVAAAVPDFVEANGRKPGLAVVLVGEDPASQVYVRSKGKATREAGMASFEHRLSADASQAELIALKACWPLQPGSSEAACNTFTLARALSAAIDLQADVLNLSLAGPADPLLARLESGGPLRQFSSALISALGDESTRPARRSTSAAAEPL